MSYQYYATQLRVGPKGLMHITTGNAKTSTTYSRAYRTTSNDALAVLADEIPISYKIIERKALYNIRRNTEVRVGEVSLLSAASTARHKTKQNNEKKVKRGDNRHVAEGVRNKGRTTHMFFPNIRKRMELKNIKINHYTTQIITGHRHFNSTLHKLRLSETDLCKCGQKDTPEHLLYEHKEEAEARSVLVQALTKEGKGWLS